VNRANGERSIARGGWKVSSKVRRAGAVLAQALAWPVELIGLTWSAPALWFDGPTMPWLAGSLPLAFAGACVTLLLSIPPVWRALLGGAVTVLLVVGW
jgi:hypothetical protein